MRTVPFKTALYGLAVLLLAVSTVTYAANIVYMAGPQVAHPEADNTPSDEKIILKDVAVAGCGDDPEERSSSNQRWLVARVSNTSHGYWAKVSGSLHFLDSDGRRVGTIGFDNRALPLAASQWLTSRRLTDHGRTSEIEAFARYELVLDEVEWTEVDGSEDLYALETELRHLSISSNEPFGHVLSLSVSNTGATPIHHVTVFATVLDAEDQLLDLLYSVEPGRWAVGERIRPGHQVLIQARSLSLTGSCLHESSSDEVRVEYWVNAMTGLGQPVATFDAVQVSERAR